MRTLRLSLHFKCKNRAIHIDLLTELHQTQAHLLCRLFLNRIAGGGDKCEQEVRADRDISALKHRPRRFFCEGDILLRFSPQRRANIHQFGATAGVMLRYSLPESTEIIACRLPDHLIICRRRVICVPIRLVVIDPDVGGDAAFQVRIVGDRFFAPHILQAQS